MSVDNVRKTLVSLSIYVRNLWADSDRADFLALFPTSTNDRLTPEDLAAVLLLPDGHDTLMRLCSLVRKHPLILHRLFRSRSMMLEGPKGVKENVQYTRQNVEWQLKRLYRARNAILHTGRAGMQLPQLTQHLHCYLVKTIHCILTDLDNQPIWTIRDSLEHRRRLFDHVVEFFGKTEGDAISVEAILRPEACLAPQAPPFAWPKPPAPEATQPVQAPASTPQ